MIVRGNQGSNAIFLARKINLETQGVLDHTNGTFSLGPEAENRKRSGCGDLSGVFALAHQLLHGDFATSSHRFFCLANPDTRIVVFLVGLVRSGWVTNLPLEEVMLLLFEFTETVPVCPLGIGINVHLDNTVFDSGLNFVIGRSRSSVHDQENGLVRCRSQLFLGKCLMLSKAFGLERNISRLVDTVNISKGSSNGEHGSNLGKSLVDGPNLFRTGVKLLGVH